MRLFAVAVLMIVIGRAAAGPVAGPIVYWISEPVRPNDTVMVQGAGLADAAVDIRRVDDAASPWSSAHVLQRDADGLKFLIPADWSMGVYAMRVRAGDATTQPRLINAPDAWWMQGDEGEAATPGGWLRVMGNALQFDRPAHARLQSADGKAIELTAADALDPAVDVDAKATQSAGYSLRFALPADLLPGEYTVSISNGYGGASTWRDAGKLRIITRPVWPDTVYNVLASYGDHAVEQMRKSINRYAAPLDREQGIRDALAKAKANGGGVVYFPAGKYVLKAPLDVPPHTRLVGEGEGLVVLFWGNGRFNIDGGGDLAAQTHTGTQTSLTGPLLHGDAFAIQNMSLYLPREFRTGIEAPHRFRMSNVRVRIDRSWMQTDHRGDGAIARVGENFQITDCDLLTTGEGIQPGGDVNFGLVARNHIAAGKCNIALGGAHNIIVEDNDFTSLTPTAYVNIPGVGRNIYYARNHQHSRFTHQGDYSFTFDAGAGAYMGGVAHVDGNQLTLADDPTFPKWANEKSSLWRRAVVCILTGRGAGQYRRVTAFNGRDWTIDHAFDPQPDTDSKLTIVPFNGRVLAVGNTFEDANWVNAGYGTSLDVIYAHNQLIRCALLVNYGGYMHGSYLPSWRIQYLDNHIADGLTDISVLGSVRGDAHYDGPITQCVVIRGNTYAANNYGSIRIGPRLDDVLVEHNTITPQAGDIRVDNDPTHVLFRDNHRTDHTPATYNDHAHTRATIAPEAAGP